VIHSTRPAERRDDEEAKSCKHGRCLQEIGIVGNHGSTLLFHAQNLGSRLRDELGAEQRTVKITERQVSEKKRLLIEDITGWIWTTRAPRTRKLLYTQTNRRAAAGGGVICSTSVGKYARQFEVCVW